MKKNFLALAMLLSMSPLAHADFFDFLGSLLRAQLDQLEQQTSLQTDLRDLGQQSVSELQKQVAALTGSTGQGNLFFDPSLASWDKRSSEWEQLLKNYQTDEGGTGPAALAKQLHRQFPIEGALIQQATPKGTQAAAYYQLHAETTLAARAASQASFDQTQKRLENLLQLQRQIDKTASVKAALDLQNRLQLENNLVQLELVRLMAMSSQQQAIAAQGNSNAAVANIEFLRH